MTLTHIITPSFVLYQFNVRKKRLFLNRFIHEDIQRLLRTQPFSNVSANLEVREDIGCRDV